jgi:hypothetical protein
MCDRYTRSRLTRIALRHNLPAAPDDGAKPGDSMWPDPLIDLAQCPCESPNWGCQFHLPRRWGWSQMAVRRHAAAQPLGL